MVRTKEDHDGSVHGHQLQVILGRHYITGRAGTGEQVQAGNCEVGKSQVDTHEPGKEHANDGGN